ncbi:arginine esterase-like [Galleria mellonella]|uniref:Arginine esterase-like n=1 Tax=Galleria mellonella TaxID=7137 RepID=A0A6J1X991_GALME|nr:arginine esterase-like [Galleria mellonella]
MMKNGIVFFIVIVTFGFAICFAENVKKSIDDNREDNGDTEEPYSMDISAENESNNITCARRQNSLMHEIIKASSKQFPFMAAIMSHQNEYLCSGSVVSNGLILTTAQCTQQSISYVLLNTTKAKKDDASTMIRVIKSDKFPSYTGSDSLKNVGLIYTEKFNSTVASKIKLSNYTSVRNILDINALGFGLNSDDGQLKELQYVGLEHRSLYDNQDILKGYFDCVETKVITCFKDTGGPVIYDNELVGIITKGQDSCTKEMSSVYAVNKFMVEALPTYTFKAWIDEKIKKNEEQDETALIVYPSKPVLRKQVHKMTSAGNNIIIMPLIVLVTFFVSTIF